MSEVKRRKNESFDAFFRRVKRGWKSRGIILEARKRTFFTPKKSSNERRKSAVKRHQIKSKTEYLRKTGRLKDEDTRFSR